MPDIEKFKRTVTTENGEKVITWLCLSCKKYKDRCCFEDGPDIEILVNPTCGDCNSYTVEKDIHELFSIMASLDPDNDEHKKAIDSILSAFSTNCSSSECRSHEDTHDDTGNNVDCSDRT